MIPLDAATLMPVEVVGHRVKLGQSVVAALGCAVDTLWLASTLLATLAPLDRAGIGKIANPNKVVGSEPAQPHHTFHHLRCRIGEPVDLAKLLVAELTVTKCRPLHLLCVTVDEPGATHIAVLELGKSSNITLLLGTNERCQIAVSLAGILACSNVNPLVYNLAIVGDLTIPPVSHSTLMLKPDSVKTRFASVELCLHLFGESVICPHHHILQLDLCILGQLKSLAVSGNADITDVYIYHQIAVADVQLCLISIIETDVAK